MFNRPITGLYAKTKQSPILFDHADDHYAALIERQQNAQGTKYICTDKNKDTKVIHLYHCSSAKEKRWYFMDTWNGDEKWL